MSISRQVIASCPQMVAHLMAALIIGVCLWSGANLKHVPELSSTYQFSDLASAAVVNVTNSHKNANIVTSDCDNTLLMIGISGTSPIAMVGYTFAPTLTSPYVSPDSIGKKLPGRIAISAIYSIDEGDDSIITIDIDPVASTISVNATAEKYAPYVEVLNPETRGCSPNSFVVYQMRVKLPMSIVVKGASRDLITSMWDVYPVGDGGLFHGYQDRTCQPLQGRDARRGFAACGIGSPVVEVIFEPQVTLAPHLRLALPLVSRHWSN